MNKFLSTFIFVCFSTTFFSQTTLFVDTVPKKKNVLIEEFTGVKCNSCPSGHIEIANLLAAYPNRLFAAGMHSYVTGHTTPYTNPNGTDEDLRRTFPDQLWPQIPGASGIPSNIISRRSFGGKESFICWPFTGFHKPIDSCANIVMAENSPFNIGLKADYDTITKTLNVTTQVYATASVTGNYRMNVYFIQSNIFVQQLNGSTVLQNYNEKHVFREILTPTWGSNMATTVLKGNVFNSAYTYDNSVNFAKYKMKDIEVIAFVTDHAGITSPKGNVIQVIGIPVNLTGPAITTGINSISNNNKVFEIYPNPSPNSFFVYNSDLSFKNEISIMDVNGKIVLKKATENKNEFLVEHNLIEGVYFVSFKNNPGVYQKLIVN